jgi:hypothetical protein
MLLAALASDAIGQEGLQVGEEVPFFRESPHPYNGSQESAIVWRDTLVYTDSACTYIAVHFSAFGLDEEDKIIVRNLEDTRRYAYSYAWLSGLDSFWSPPIWGNTIVLEIHALNSQGAYGYAINKLARGFTASELAERAGEPEQFDGICGDDNKLNAICFQSIDPLAYNRARAVGRVWRSPTGINGTGWFWGGDGHFMTAMHLFSKGSSPATQAQYEQTTLVEIMAESESCSSGCEGNCLGFFVSQGFTEIAYELAENSDDMDFTLLQLKMMLNLEPLVPIKYLQVREGGAKLHERVYIPGYPGGGEGPPSTTKMVSYYSDQEEDILLSPYLENGLGFVHLLSVDSDIHVYNNSNHGLLYNGDTEGGMSGSPVIGYNDNLVIGLHTRAKVPLSSGCPNGGVSMWPIVNIIGPELLPPNAIGVDCYPTWTDITITGDELIDDVFLSTGNIYIENGAQLHVTGTLYMPEGGEIVVDRNARLAVYGGGTITKCPHSRDKWKGISLRGNSSKEQPAYHPDPYQPALNDPDKAGEVFVDSGYIYYAEVCISTRNPANDPDYYGGVIYIPQGYFDYNTLNIELMPYPLQNKSWIKRSIFQKSEKSAGNAIWIWGNTGLEISKSRFLHFNHEAIRAFDSSIRILDDNHFEGCERAVSFEATMPNPFSDISVIGTLDLVPNYFLNNDFHITGWGPPRINVIKNQFKGGISGIHLAGTSRYDIAGNSFESMERGVVLFSTGYNQTAISSLSCNDFEVSDYGSVAVGDNRRTRYWGNQFDLSGAESRDLMVSQFYIPGWWLYPGQIYNPQGDIQFPTDNCFTVPGQKIDILTNGSTIHFDFFHRPSGSLTCGYEPLNPGNYTKYETSDELEPHDCYQFIVGATIPEPASLTALDSLRQLITELAPHTESSTDTLVWYNQVWEEKEALLHYLVMAALDTNDVTSAEQIINGENSVAADWAIYGLRLSRGDISGAASWLSQMSDTSDVEQDFYAVQAINLAFRHDTTGTFALDSIELHYLVDLAYGGSPVRDYARSLLGLLEGHRFYPEIPEEEAELRDAHSDSIPFHQSGWNIYPVPASDQLQLSWNVGEYDATWEVTIIDMMGRSMLNDRIQAAASHHVINLSEFRNGIFYIAIYSQKGEILHQASIVIFR